MDVDEAYLSEGTLVQIAGLASEAGKALNDGHAFILKGKPSDVGGSLRYPVKVYALVQENKLQMVETPDFNRSIKATNLQVLEDQKEELFKEAALAQMMQLVQNPNDPTATPWFAAFCDKWPDGAGDRGIVLHYANVLNSITKEPKKALAVILPIADSLTPDNCTMYNQFLCLYVEICCSAESHIEQAMERALLIPTNTEDAKHWALRALFLMLGYLSQKNERDPQNADPAMLQLQLRSAQAIYDIDPTKGDNVKNLGAALCLNGDNSRGAKCYRQALAIGGTTTRRQDVQICLIQAQLQCPSMPLEKYIVLSDNGSFFRCIHKDDKDKCQIAQNSYGNGRATTTLHVSNEAKEDMSLIDFPIPASPDDPEVFPRAFLDSLE